MRRDESILAVMGAKCLRPSFPFAEAWRPREILLNAAWLRVNVRRYWLRFETLLVVDESPEALAEAWLFKV